MIHYQIFEPFENIIAFTTEKCDGFTDSSRFTGDYAGLFMANRQKLAARIGISPHQLVFPRQTHSDHVAVIGGPPASELTDTDALITGQPCVCVCVQTADCVPVLLFDPFTGTIGAVHAGWRGTAKKIVKEAIFKMINQFGTNPGNVLAAIGPSISPRVYEVGTDVVSVFRDKFPDSESFISPMINNKWLLDLCEVNRQIMTSIGVGPHNIEILGRCSFQEQDSFYSARRDGQQTGRIVSGICMKS